MEKSRTTNKDLFFNIAGLRSSRQDKRDHTCLLTHYSLSGRCGLEMEAARNWKHSCCGTIGYQKDPRWPLPAARRHDPMQQQVTQQRLGSALHRFYPHFHNLALPCLNMSLQSWHRLRLQIFFLSLILILLYPQMYLIQISCQKPT